MSTTQAQHVQPGQTVRFKRWSGDRQRVTVQVEKVQTYGRSTVFTGHRITRSTRNADWTTVHRSHCFSVNADASVEIVQDSVA